MIISILNEKGGVGKTTLTTNLAKIFKNAGSSVLLVDSDPQGSARDWHVNSDGDVLDVIGLDRPTLDKDIIRIARQYDYVFIDGAPQLTNMALKAILCSNFILIPVQPSPYDIWASKNLVDLIKQRQDVTNGKPVAAFVVSRQISGTNIGKEVRTVLDEYGLPVFKNGTFQRVSYAETAARGQTVIGSKDCHADAEIRAIGQELMEFIDGNS